MYPTTLPVALDPKFIIGNDVPTFLGLVQHLVMANL